MSDYMKIPLTDKIRLIGDYGDSYRFDPQIHEYVDGYQPAEGDNVRIVLEGVEVDISEYTDIKTWVVISKAKVCQIPGTPVKRGIVLRHPEVFMRISTDGGE